MSELPTPSAPAATAGKSAPSMWGDWQPSADDPWTPWGKSLWGTTIDFGNGQRLVIDKDGVGHYTDAAGETGTWDPDLFGWRDDDGTFKDSTFGIPGMEVTSEQVEAVVEKLAEWADSPFMSEEKSRAIRDRARALWETVHDPETDPYPYE